MTDTVWTMLALPAPQRLLLQPGNDHHGRGTTTLLFLDGAPTPSGPPIYQSAAQTNRARPEGGARRRREAPVRSVRRSRCLHTCADIAPEPPPTRVDVERASSPFEKRRCRGGAGEGVTVDCRQAGRRRVPVRMPRPRALTRAACARPIGGGTSPRATHGWLLAAPKLAVA